MKFIFLLRFISLNSFPGALKRKENIKLKIKLGSEGWWGVMPTPDSRSKNNRVTPKVMTQYW